MATGPIYNAVRESNGSGSNGGEAPGSTAVTQVSPTGSNFSGSTVGTITKRDLKDATKHRKGFAIFTSVLFFVSLIMLLLVQIGNLSSMKVLSDLYFFKIDTSNIAAAAGSQTLASGAQAVVRSAGLKDFYQAGLWNFCEGYKDKGITACSKPMTMFWFNPVQIMTDELLAGASVPLPESAVDFLELMRSSSNIMFVALFGATIASLVCVILCPLAVYSRVASIPIAIFTLLTALATMGGAAVSTLLWSTARRTILGYAGDLNIVPSVGLKMTVFVWVSAGCALVAALGQLGMLCCGTSRRDIKTGRRVGRKLRERKLVTIEENPVMRRRWWGSVSQ